MTTGSDATSPAVTTASNGRAGLRLSVPSGHMIAGETVEARFLPPSGGWETRGRFEVDLTGPPAVGVRRDTPAGNQWKRSDLDPGVYRLRVRWAPARAPDDWSEWSTPVTLSVHPPDDRAAIAPLQVADHRLALMAERDLQGVMTITEPWALPPACPEDEPVAWFRTPCFDGSGMIINEEPDYYRDPLAYYLQCIDILRDRGTSFLTWHDVLEGNTGSGARAAIIQFDVDAGPRSMTRLYEALETRGVRATIMVHREAHDWYEYRVEDELDMLVAAERCGWAIGYHNNAIGNTQRCDRLGDYGSTVLAEATRRFRDDVAFLRRRLDVRTFTHHGGVHVNKYTPVPEDVDIVAVDRPVNPELWAPIAGSFSDGGFLARPAPLRARVRELPEGLFFFRNHPLKYANYRPPFDVAPLEIDDALRAGAPRTVALETQVREGIEKQAQWLAARSRHRLATRTGHDRFDRPISRDFAPFETIATTVERFRQRRRPTFLRQYPWAPGDPRVFWWRMLQTHAPHDGEFLNVGALPPPQRDENTAFLEAGVTVREMDVDASREPDFVGDVVEAPADWNGRFAAVLLLGLPYFPTPDRAIDACRRLVSSAGVGLFGFAADTHPTRGGLWRPDDRPVWRPGLPPLDDPGLQTRLWSFDRDGVDTLFAGWAQTSVEFFADYWFVVASTRAE